MSKRVSIFMGTIAAASLMAGQVAPAIAAEPAADVATSAGSEQGTFASENTVASEYYVKADASEGVFSWTQGEITPNEVIRNVFAKAANALCNAQTDFIADNPLQWKISVSGDVQNAYTATVDEIAEEQEVSQTMTCTCGGNPSDGAATITADVKGLPVSYLVQRAAANADVNTITFVASDGTEVAMPLAYAVGHHGVISYEINDEDLSASVGGNNQLWLAGTSANYFVRDIVEIRVTHEDRVPAAPGEGMEYPNSPNAGIQSADAA